MRYGLFVVTLLAAGCAADAPAPAAVPGTGANMVRDALTNLRNARVAAADRADAAPVAQRSTAPAPAAP